MPWYRTGSFVSRATNGTQSLASITPEAPQCVRFWTNQDTTQDASRVDALLSVGAMTASAQFVCAIGSGDALVTSDANRRHENAACILIMGAPGNVVGRASFASMDSTGFTLTWANVTAGSRIVYWEAWGDYDGIVIKQFQGGSGEQTYTGVGFASDLILFHTLVSTNTPANGTIHATLGLGAATSPSAQFAIGYSSEDNSGAADTDYSQVNDKAISTVFNNALFWQGTLTEINADGFKMTFSTTDTRYAWAICFSGGRHKVLQVAQKTTTGTQAYSGWGVGTPIGISLFSANRTANASQGAHANWSVGAASSPTARWALWLGDVDAADPMEADEDNDSAAIYKYFTPGTPTLNVETDIDSFDSDGATFDTPTADGSAYLLTVVAYGDDAAETPVEADCQSSRDVAIHSGVVPRPP
jgi:hypothetical protein